MSDHVTRAHVGAAAEHRLIAELLERGHSVAIPVVDDGIDLVVDRTLAVQVKATSTYRCDFRLRGRHGLPVRHHIAADVDVVAVWSAPERVWYLLKGDFARSQTTYWFSAISDTREDWTVFDACG